MTDQTPKNATTSNSDSVPEVQLFAARKKIYPRAVDGIYRRRKWLVMVLCLLAYYITPFIRWDRGPFAPDQAILLDMVHRRGYFLFLEIWPQEVYYLTGVLVIAAIGLFFATSLFGRVWCGYFCFQTIWTDLFMWVERRIQGDSAARKRLDQNGFNLNYLVKKGATHLSWLFIALMTGGTFTLYFTDAPTLIHDLWTGNFADNTSAITCALGLTFSTYIMAGFAREQVCTFMCPYARFQSAMFDEDSLIIAYDTVRGEPRGKHKQGDSWEGKGHCIDCTQCVQVCPTGIDIRNGLQIQCIACGLCVDACDSVMDKVGLPRGLVRYDTAKNMREEAAKCAGHADLAAQDMKKHKAHLVRPRTIYYTAILGIVCTLMVYSIATRDVLNIHALHDRNPLFVQLSDGRIRNDYKINILNKVLAPQTFRLEVTGPEGLTFVVREGRELDATALPAPPDDVAHYNVSVSAPKAGPDREPITFKVINSEGTNTAEVTDVFIRKNRKN